MEHIAKQLLTKYAGILKPMVEAIETKPETTRNHYGDYMALIGRCTKEAPIEQKAKRTQFTALALILAGANTQGVQDATQLLTGGNYL